MKISIMLSKLFQRLKKYRQEHYAKPWEDKSLGEKAVFLLIVLVVYIILSIILKPVYRAIGLD